MKLRDFLSTLALKTAQVTCVDNNTEEEVVQLRADGYESLADAVANREVVRWTITGATAVTAILGNVIE